MPFRRSTTSLACRCALVLSTGVLLSSCAGRALAPNVADGLRSDLATRTRERDAAVARSKELEAKLETLTRERSVAVDPEVAAAMPALASLGLSSDSAARSTSPTTAQLAILLAPADGLGRFIQITGRVRASVAALPAGGEPIKAGSVELTPRQLRDCYRSGFMGTHYTIEFPVEWKGGEGARALSISGEFVDGLTGRRYPFMGTVPVVPGRPAAPAAPAAATDVR